MKTQFTPGPWTAPADKSFYVVSGERQNEFVCNASTQANARAIAALPDLVAALEECITETPGAACFNTGKKTRRLEHINSVVSAALAKVKG